MKEYFDRKTVIYIFRRFFLDIRECEFTDSTSLRELNDYIDKWVKHNIPPDIWNDDVK